MEKGFNDNPLTELIFSPIVFQKKVSPYKKIDKHITRCYV